MLMKIPFTSSWNATTTMLVRVIVATYRAMQVRNKCVREEYAFNVWRVVNGSLISQYTHSNISYICLVSRFSFSNVSRTIDVRLTFPLDAPKEETGEFNLSRNVIWFNYIYWINFYHRLFLFHFHKFVINVRIKFRILPRFHFGNGTKVFIILIRHRVNRNK